MKQNSSPDGFLVRLMPLLPLRSVVLSTGPVNGGELWLLVCGIESEHLTVTARSWRQPFLKARPAKALLGSLRGLGGKRRNIQVGDHRAAIVSRRGKNRASTCHYVEDLLQISISLIES